MPLKPGSCASAVLLPSPCRRWRMASIWSGGICTVVMRAYMVTSPSCVGYSEPTCRLYGSGSGSVSSLSAKKCFWSALGRSQKRKPSRYSLKKTTVGDMLLSVGGALAWHVYHPSNAPRLRESRCNRDGVLCRLVNTARRWLYRPSHRLAQLRCLPETARTTRPVNMETCTILTGRVVRAFLGGRWNWADVRGGTTALG